MENRYYNDFIKNEYTLKYGEYQELDKIKLTRWAKRLFMFLYMVYKENNNKECSSFLLSMEQIKEITECEAKIKHSLYHYDYLKHYIKIINHIWLIEVAFLPLKNGKTLVWWEFMISQNTEQ